MSAAECTLDSMFLVGYVLAHDPLTQESESLFCRIGAGRLRATASVVSLQETAYVLKKEGLSREQVRDALRLLASIPHMEFAPLSSDLLDRALDYLAKYSLTLGDAVICATAVLAGLPLLTHDKALLGLPFVRTVERI